MSRKSTVRTPRAEASSPTADQLAMVTTLHEPLRRRLYEFVAGQAGPVTRDQAAEAMAVARTVAAFHLDKLATAGLLTVEFARPPGRPGGPGAGRPAKHYRRAGTEINVSLPERRYGLAADLLAQAVVSASAAGTDAGREAHTAARRYGRSLGEQVTGLPRSVRGRLRALIPVLTDQGFEPCEDNGTLRLRNCPFRSLSQRHPQLVCGMNLELVAGLLDGSGCTDLRAERQSDASCCCVQVRSVSQR